MRDEELEFLGLNIDLEKFNPTFQKHEEQRNKLKSIKTQNETLYQGALVEQKLKLKINEGPDIKEKMLSERREWILNMMEETDYSQVPTKPQEFYERH